MTNVNAGAVDLDPLSVSQSNSLEPELKASQRICLVYFLATYCGNLDLEVVPAWQF